MATAEVDLGDPIPRSIRTPTMSTGTFPSSHTTMTATRDQTTTCHCDPTYIRTVPGIIKILQVTFSVVGLICILSSRMSSSSRGVFFCFVSGMGFSISEILLLFHSFNFPHYSPMVPWLMVELIFCSAWTILYLIAASVVAAWGKFYATFGVAAFFGFAAVVAYGYNAYINICELHLNKVARNRPNAENQPRDADSRTPKMYI